MITFSYTKPSRVNRRRKRKWRNVTLADLIKAGLTDCYGLAHNVCAVSTLAAGFSTPVYGENRREPLRYFFARHICSALCRQFIMVARGGPQKCGPVPYPGVENPLRAASRLFSTIDGDLFLQDMESPL